AQTIVDGELRRDLPLVLREEAGVAMVQIDRVILRIHIGVCPRGRNSWRQTSGRDGPGSNRRSPKNNWDSVQKAVIRVRTGVAAREKWWGGGGARPIRRIFRHHRCLIDEP